MIIPANSESSISFVDPKEIKQTDGRIEKLKELEERVKNLEDENKMLTDLTENLYQGQVKYGEFINKLLYTFSEFYQQL